MHSDSTALPMGSFGHYSNWYDAFYTDKDYAGECRYLMRKVSRPAGQPESWLDIGCGTGRHLAWLKAAGLDVAGVDKSPQMIQRAQRNCPEIDFTVAEATAFNLRRRFDVASFLFHVFSYLVRDSEALDSLETARRHLNPEGVLIFDFWHQAALLRNPPGRSVKAREIGGRKLYRIGRPECDRERDTVTVHYEFRLDSESGPLAHREQHVLRHYDPAFLQDRLHDCGYQLLACEGWMTDEAIGSADWSGLMVARAV